MAECGIRVLAQEVPQRRDKLPSMSNIVLPNGCANLSDQHVPDLFAPALALEQVMAKHSSCRWGNTLVRGHNLDLVKGEIAEADYVFKRDHRRLRHLRRTTQLYWITCGFQSLACGTAARFVALLRVLQTFVWHLISTYGADRLCGFDELHTCGSAHGLKRQKGELFAVHGASKRASPPRTISLAKRSYEGGEYEAAQE